MDRLNSLPRNQVLKELQTYKKYQGNTQKDISSQFNAIADLRSELYKLEKKSKKNTKTDKNEKSKKVKNNQPQKDENLNENIFPESGSFMPNDILKETLLHSDLKTILNMCSASKHNQQLCNQEFWMNKLKHDKLPIIENDNWPKYYQEILDAQTNAKYMIEIIETYNKYKGEGIIRLWYDYGDVNPLILKLIKLNLNFSSNIAIDFTYLNKSWTVNRNQSNKIKEITNIDLLNILTEEIYNQLHGKKVDFHDYDEHELLYTNLLKKSKQNRPIPRAYLMAYELLMK